MKLIGITALAAMTVALAACGSTGSTVSKAAASGVSTPTQTSDGTLIGPNGRTLYVFAKDGKNTGASECYDACEQNWPPLAAPDNAQAIGDYTMIIRSDASNQWAYKGHPLYYYAKDSKPGDKNGASIADWSVANANTTGAAKK